MILLYIIGIFLSISGAVFFWLAINIKIKRNEQQENYKQRLKMQIRDLENEKNTLIDLQSKKKDQINKDLLNWQEDRKKEINKYIEAQKQLAEQTVNKSYEIAKEQTLKINNEVKNYKDAAEQERKQVLDELNKIKASLSAGIQACLREQEKEEKINFYKLSLNNADLADVTKLENLKNTLNKPVVLSKLIWSQYFQKQMTELCDRVLGKKNVCGIYKITNLLTKQCYIGQSLDIAKRWKDHCKCGLGIEASSTNKLYNSMQKDGVWNFSFELLEECPREQLNEKETFWIDMYSSNIYGLNSVKGIKI